MSLDGFRIPLQEQKVEINTPLPVKNGQKITTPPETILALRKKSLSMETPVKTIDPSGDSHRGHKSNLLLSPAFSSPQNQLKSNTIPSGSSHNPYMTSSSSSSSFSSQPGQLSHHSGAATAAPAEFNSSPTNNANTLSSFDEEFDEDKPKKKKKKEKKVFDIQSSDKPPYSYATLIGMSILSNPDKRLTLSSIYQWISDTFKYYKREDVGWQNSIRHNLSLNKAFIKGEKSKDGKGHFWCIEPGSEDQFLKLRNNKKSSYHEIMDQINSQNVQSASHDHEQKRSIDSLPSSPNYYESNDGINTFNRFESMSGTVKHDSVEDLHGHEEDRINDNNSNDNNDQDETFDDELDGSTPEDSLDFSNKRQKLNNKESNLGAPFNQSWNLTPRPFKSFGHHHKSNSLTNSQNINSSGSTSAGPSHFDLMSTPKLVISESPNKPLLAGKNLTFTSSFSCNSNLELSPIRPNETGPLLEPLTPGKIYKSGAINHHLSNLNYNNVFSGTNTNNLNNLSSNLNSLGSNFNSNSSSNDSNTSSHKDQGQDQGQDEAQDVPKPSHVRTHSRTFSNHLHPPSLQPPISTQTQLATSFKSQQPSSQGTSSSHGHSHLRTPKSSGNNHMRTTPMRVLKTPQNNSARKLWNSPGYLDDFYYSPLITSQSALHSYDDDDMILRAFESPANNNYGHSRNHSHGHSSHNRHPYYNHNLPAQVHRRINSGDLSKNLFQEPKVSVNSNDKGGSK